MKETFKNLKIIYKKFGSENKTAVIIKNIENFAIQN